MIICSYVLEGHGDFCEAIRMWSGKPEKSKTIVNKIAVVQVKECENIRRGGKCLDSGYILKIEQRDCWMCGKEKNRR